MSRRLDQLARDCSERLAGVADDRLSKGDVGGGLLALGGAFLAAYGAAELAPAPRLKRRRLVTAGDPRGRRVVSGEAGSARRTRRGSTSGSVIDAEFVEV